ATTAACSSTRAPGRPTAATPTPRCPTRPAPRSRWRWRTRSSTTAAATAPGPPAPASSACPASPPATVRGGGAGRSRGRGHAGPVSEHESRLLGPAEVRALAGELGVRPTKRLGQNFVHDPNTVRRIVRAAELGPDDVVV